MSHFHNKKKPVPETVTGTEGTAKRNIIRRGSGGSQSRKESASGASVDDGSTYDDPAALNEEDPNYDSQEDDGKELSLLAQQRQREEIGRSRLTLTQYKKRVQPVIKEFFVSGDFEDVAISLNEIGAPEYSYEFVKRLINTAIDLGDKQREQASQLLSALYPDLLSMSTIGKGFERLFEVADEIEIDAPQAGNIIAAFVARAVIDEVLPPSFLSDHVVRNLGGEIIEHAKLLLSRDHIGAKLERIWGPGDGRPVEEMKIAVDQLLEEFLLSSDFDEAERCVRELQAPQFHHEVVKRAVTLSLDKLPTQQLLMSQFLAHLAGINLLSVEQAEKGFNRLYGMLSDLSLDVPNAKDVLEDFTARAVADKVLSAEYKAEPIAHAASNDFV